MGAAEGYGLDSSGGRNGIGLNASSTSTSHHADTSLANFSAT